MRIDRSRTPVDALAPPRGAPGRDRGIDALRGFALFGVILVNAPFFAFPVAQGPAIATTADAVAFGALMLLGIGKFFLIFSFLFGFGFASAIAADRAAGRASGPRFARRLTGLLAFGALHASLFFIGDILMLYVLLGGALWLARGLAPRRLLALAAGIYLVAVFAQAFALTLPVPEVDPAIARAEAAYLGTFLDAARFRLAEDLWSGQAFILIFNGPAALAMFFAGLALARTGTFPGRAGRRGRGRWPWLLLAAGLGIGALSLAGAEHGRWMTGAAAGLPGALLHAAAAPLLAAGYGLLILRFADRAPGSAWVAALAAAGRMTLTGYLLHSIVLSAVFGGWGLGLWGGVGAAQCLAIGAVTCVLIVVLAALWQRGFRYGPDEWLLRAWIDLRVKPLRRGR